jgi:hypothetical protein
LCVRLEAALRSRGGVLGVMPDDAKAAEAVTREAAARRDPLRAARQKGPPKPERSDSWIASVWQRTSSALQGGDGDGAAGAAAVDGALSIDVRAEMRRDEQSLAKLSATSSSLGAELAAQQRAVRRCVEEMAESHARAERASGAAARAVQLEAAAAAAELNSLRRERAESPAGGDDFGGDDFGGYDDELMEV